MPAWFVWTLVTLVSWGVWAICPRMIGSHITAAQSQAMSTLGILPVLVALAAMRTAAVPGGRSGRGMALALASGVLSALGNVACYAAMRSGKVAAVNALIAMAPVVTVALAVPVFRERLNGWQLLGVALSIASIGLFNVPRETDAATTAGNSWLILSLAAIVLFGVTGLLQKAATNEVSPRLAALGFLAAFLPLGVAILLIDPLDGPLDGAAPRDWCVATIMGFTLAFGNFTILKAFAADGKASIIAPLAGLFPLVSIPIALAVFGERLGPLEIAGVALALTAVVMLSRQDAPLPSQHSATSSESLP